MANSGGGTVTLLAGGDINVPEPVEGIADLILPALKEADLRFAQCERTHTDRHIEKPDPGAPHGPHGVRGLPFKNRAASVYKAAGIDIVSMASNHTGDWGGEVLMDTIELFQGMGMHAIGAGKNIEEARKPAIVERNGVNIAFLAYCSVLPEDHEARHNKAGLAPMRARTYYQRGGDAHEEYQPGGLPSILTVPHKEDVAALVEDIKKAKQQADVVVVSMHWGVHHIPKYIADYQPVVAHAAIDAGADLILGHHPHCLKAIEVYKGKVCFYSIGNFLSPGNKKKHVVWGFYYYHVDEECKLPHGRYSTPREARMTMLAKAVFSKKGVEKVSFLPVYINPQAQPAVVEPNDPKFKEIFNYTEWLSEEFPHKLRIEGKEIVVDTSV